MRSILPVHLVRKVKASEVKIPQAQHLETPKKHTSRKLNKRSDIRLHLAGKFNEKLLPVSNCEDNAMDYECEWKKKLVQHIPALGAWTCIGVLAPPMHGEEIGNFTQYNIVPAGAHDWSSRCDDSCRPSDAARPRLRHHNRAPRPSRPKQQFITELFKVNVSRQLNRKTPPSLHTITNQQSLNAASERQMSAVRQAKRWHRATQATRWHPLPHKPSIARPVTQDKHGNYYPLPHKPSMTPTPHTSQAIGGTRMARSQCRATFEAVTTRN